MYTGSRGKMGKSKKNFDKLKITSSQNIIKLSSKTKHIAIPNSYQIEFRVKQTPEQWTLRIGIERWGCG